MPRTARLPPAPVVALAKGKKAEVASNDISVGNVLGVENCPFGFAIQAGTEEYGQKGKQDVKVIEEQALRTSMHTPCIREGRNGRRWGAAGQLPKNDYIFMALVLTAAAARLRSPNVVHQGITLNP